MSYIANEALFIGIHRAFNAGDEVPEEHVEKYGWADKVSGAAKPFDPSEHNAEAVQVYLQGVSADEATRVLDLERAGKARKSLLGE